MAGNNIREKVKRVKEQGYRSAREDRLYPRELQNMPEGQWDDAKVYGSKTRQGQNNRQDYVKWHGEYLTERQRNKNTPKAESTKRNVFDVPTQRKPMWATVANQSREEVIQGYQDKQYRKKLKEETARKQRRNAIADRLLKK